MAVLLAEQSTYTVNLDQDELDADGVEAGVPRNTKQKGKKATQAAAKQPKKPPGVRKKEAEARGAKRGSGDGTHDAILVRAEPRLHAMRVDEGLHTFVQTGICRCAVLTKIYNNSPPCEYFTQMTQSKH